MSLLSLTSDAYYKYGSGQSIHVSSLRTDAGQNTQNYLLLNQSNISCYGPQGQDVNFALNPAGNGCVRIENNPLELKESGTGPVVGRAIIASGNSQVTVQTTQIDSTAARVFLSPIGSTGALGKIFTYANPNPGEIIIQCNDSSGAAHNVSADVEIDWVIFKGF